MRGWFDLYFIKMSDCDGILAGISHVTERLLEAQGFLIITDIPERGFDPLTLAFGVILADEEAMKHVLSVKGAGSYPPVRNAGLSSAGCCHTAT